MYESPIELFTKTVAPKISETVDGMILDAVIGANINVDRDELIKALAYDRRQYEKGFEDGKADAWKWISVKDRLPENEKTVLISAVRKCANGKHWNVVMTAFYTDGKLHTEDSSFAWDCDYVEMEYCEETDDYIIPEGWWEAVECGDEFSAVDLFVTHWMPMPEAPEEDSNENNH